MVAYDADDDPDLVGIPCNAAFAGQPVSVTPSGGDTPIVTVKPATLSVSVGDTDGVVKAGGADLGITIRFRNLVQFGHNAELNENDDDTDNVSVLSTMVSPTATQDGSEGAAGVELLWVRVSGELSDPEEIPTTAWVNGALMTTLPIPAGTSSGGYTISAAVRYDPNTVVEDDDRDGSTDDEDGTVLTATKVITVGDPGIDAAAVSLTLGNASEDNPLTTKTTGKGELIPEDGTEPASNGDVFLKVAAMNSAGNPSNDGGLTTMTVIAPGGSIKIYGPNALRTAPGMMVTGATGNNSASITMAADVKNTMFILVGKADKKPGTVDVYTLLILSLIHI